LQKSLTKKQQEQIQKEIFKNIKKFLPISIFGGRRKRGGGRVSKNTAPPVPPKVSSVSDIIPQEIKEKQKKQDETTMILLESNNRLTENVTKNKQLIESVNKKLTDLTNSLTSRDMRPSLAKISNNRVGGGLCGKKSSRSNRRRGRKIKKVKRKKKGGGRTAEKSNSRNISDTGSSVASTLNNVFGKLLGKSKGGRRKLRRKTRKTRKTKKRGGGRSKNIDLGTTYL